MSKYIEQEAKRILIKNGQSLSKINLDNKVSEILDSELAEIVSLSESTDNNVINASVKALKDIGDINATIAKIEEVSDFIEKKFELLNKKTRTSLYEKLKLAKILNKYTSEEILLSKNLPLIKTNFSVDSTTLFDENKIIGLLEDSSAELTTIDTSGISISSIEVNSGTRSVNGLLLEQGSSGWIVPEKDKIFKNTGNFKIKCYSESSSKNLITVNIDIGKATEVSSFRPKFKQPEIIEILTSIDNIEFKNETGKIVSKNSQFIFNKNTRYIKVIIHKELYSYKENSRYVYESLLENILISNLTSNKETVFESKEIGINLNLSKISIDTLDNNNDEVNIDYFIKINNKEYEQIRPSRSSKNIDVKTYIDTQMNIENKLIKLEGFEKEEGEDSYINETEIPQGFMISNNIEVFNDIYEWLYLENKYSCYIFNYEDKEIDTGSKKILVNGKEFSGIVKLKKGLNKIGIYKEDFIKLFNRKLIKKYEINGNTILITLRDNSSETVVDSMYPYNIKLLIEENCDFVFKEKLKEDKDFWLIQSEENNNLKVKIKEKRKELYIVYNNLYNLVSTIKIKGILNSIDNKKIPIIEQITIKGE